MGEMVEILGINEGSEIDTSIYPSPEELAQEERRREEERYNRECGPVKVYKLGAEDEAVYIMPSQPEPKMAPEDLTKEALIAELEKGLTAWKIGEKYGLTQSNVQKLKRKWGLTRGRKNGI